MSVYVPQPGAPQCADCDQVVDDHATVTGKCPPFTLEEARRRINVLESRVDLQHDRANVLQNKLLSLEDRTSRVETIAAPVDPRILAERSREEAKRVREENMRKKAFGNVYLWVSLTSEERDRLMPLLVLAIHHSIDPEDRALLSRIAERIRR